IRRSARYHNRRRKPFLAPPEDHRALLPRIRTVLHPGMLQVAAVDGQFGTHRLHNPGQLPVLPAHHAWPSRQRLTHRTVSPRLPDEQINYIRNSVKATVDAYDGTVTLYAMDESDPVLRTWMSVFPGTVQPTKAISD